MLMMKLTFNWNGYLCFNMESNCNSFITEVTLFFETILHSQISNTWPST
jgi:hypothetical protein